MPFEINLDPFERAFSHFLADIGRSIQATYAQESENGLTVSELADTLGISENLVGRMILGPDNITLSQLSDLFTAMGRLPLSNFTPPSSDCAKTD